MWIDTHCHLDAPDFKEDRQTVVTAAQKAGVKHIVIPAVSPAHFKLPITLAHEYKFSYALGLHPLWMEPECSNPAEQQTADGKTLQTVTQALEQHKSDLRLVAVGEIGLDYFVKELRSEASKEFDRRRQWYFYIEQLKLAKKFNLPVILHLRRSADMLLKGLREVGSVGGIVHAFNGSEQQAQMFITLGFKLGFGGAATYERAKQIRHLAKTLPLESLVLETDAPDMPPRWLYKTAKEREQGVPQGRNEPAELSCIAAELAQLRGISLKELSEAVAENTVTALPKLKQLL